MVSTIQFAPPTEKLLYERLTSSLVAITWRQHIPAKQGQSAFVHHGLATGFLMEVKGMCLWVTAGHVLEQMEQSFAYVKPNWVGFLDDIAGKHSFPCGPFDFEGSQRLYLDDDRTGVDVGFLVVRPLYRALFEKAGCLPFAESDWMSVDDCPAAHYLVGLPQEGRLLKDAPEGSSYHLTARVPAPAIRLAVEASPTVVPANPVAQIHFKIPAASWVDGVPAVPSDISGMSGGPVLTVSGPIASPQVRLLAIQSRWNSETRVIAATMAAQLGLAIKNVLESASTGSKHAGAFPSAAEEPKTVDAAGRIEGA